MPFVFHNAFGTFQRKINVILSAKKCKFIVVYLDYIIIFSCNENEHILRVRTVLSLSDNAGVALNLKKGNFFSKKINFLEHVTRSGKLELADQATDAIWDLKPPGYVSKLK